MKFLKSFIFLAFLIGFGFETASAVTPGHDHHVVESGLYDQADSSTSSGTSDRPEKNENSEHGRHALHGCGVCHHAIGFGLAISSPYQQQLPVRFERFDDRMNSRPPEPPFTPPIFVSA
ncbi:hypothetical protein [Hyphobacterium sp.]|uniref:hypothetical protein n=1 Tax=Hyphobacterium sp. TaxID=2004662 RepID=UPI003BA8829D